MHICKERGGISEFLHRSLMMSKDKMEVTEKILSLTLEIIFLLTGEDFVLSKKKNNQTSDDCQACLSEESTKDQSPCKESPCQSPAHEKTPEEETPEPSETTHSMGEVTSKPNETTHSMGEVTSKPNETTHSTADKVTPKPIEITHSTAEEVPVRCEDVAIFFSMEEWEYLEGHKERYKNVVSERQQSTGCDGVNAAEEAKELNNNIQVDPAAAITDAPSTGGHSPAEPCESCPSPPTLQECMEEDDGMETQEMQDHPAEEISPLQCKEEDVPVEISSGDHSPIHPLEISGDPVCPQDCVEEGNRMIPQVYQAKTEDILPKWCKKEPDPPKINSGLPTSWKVQPDTPHLLIPVHHKNGANPRKMEGSISSNSPPMVVMVKPKTVLNEAPPPRSKPDLSPRFWQKPKVDASSSSLMNFGGGAINLPPIQESPLVHKCLQCGRSFRNHIDLISHQRTHEKVFHCALCQQSFMDKSALVVHEWTFHIQEPKMGEPAQTKPSTKDDRPFSCLECGKSFMKKSSLVKHQRIHTGAFACPDCGKCLSDKTGLIIHRRTHTGEKPYACSECGRRFTQRCHLITHQSVHNSKESFACSDCGKCFSVRSVLEAHQAFHNRHKAFTCSDCGRCFLQRSALMAHSKVHAQQSDSMS
ncbi:zinc finger protein 197-like [Hyla sarda]|uniref:zinc finger protein 197-like n=1 Tax=Hyla sarda TaxID=327740 RepID=UPI0024C43C64|nr:zinc finger protein 197-like [Hyla sarda]